MQFWLEVLEAAGGMPPSAEPGAPKTYYGVVPQAKLNALRAQWNRPKFGLPLG